MMIRKENGLKRSGAFGVERLQLGRVKRPEM